MGIASALLARRDPVELRTIRDSDFLNAWARGDDFGATAETPAGVRVTRQTALGLSAVWACVSLIADSIATLPVDTFTSTGKTRVPYKTPGWLEQPNPEQTTIDWIFNQVASLLLDGNAFIYTVRDRLGDVVEAWVLDPNWVQVRREFRPDGSLELVYYVMVARGQQSPVGPFRVPAGPDMFHIVGMQSHSGYPRGLPPIEIARMMYGGAIASQEMGARFFGSGMNASGVLEAQGDVTDAQARQIKRDFAEANGGIRKMGLPPVLTGGMKYQQISVSPEQAQFLQHRQFTVEEVARWFRVPPHMIGELQRTTSWGTGITYQGMTFVNFTLRPWLTRLESSWTRHMLTFDDDAFIWFDVSELLRGDASARADYYQKRFQTGSISPNEIKEAEGEAPFDGGDDHYYPANMLPVGVEPQLVEIPKEQPIPEDGPGVAGANWDPRKGLETRPLSSDDLSAALGRALELTRDSSRGEIAQALSEMRGVLSRQKPVTVDVHVPEQRETFQAKLDGLDKAVEKVRASEASNLSQAVFELRQAAREMKAFMEDMRKPKRFRTELVKDEAGRPIASESVEVAA